MPAYIEQAQPLRQLLGASVEDWEVEELAGGVINAAWAVTRRSGAAGSGGASQGGPHTPGLLLKQAPPYVRAVGPSFPLSTERMEVEAAAMQRMHALAPAHVPRLLYYDAPNSVLAMPLLAPPGHVPLSDAIRDGQVGPGAFFWGGGCPARLDAQVRPCLQAQCALHKRHCEQTSPLTAVSRTPCNTLLPERCCRTCRASWASCWLPCSAPRLHKRWARPLTQRRLRALPMPTLWRQTSAWCWRAPSRPVTPTTAGCLSWSRMCARSGERGRMPAWAHGRAVREQLVARGEQRPPPQCCPPRTRERGDAGAMESAAHALAEYRSNRQCLIHNDLHFGEWPPGEIGVPPSRVTAGTRALPPGCALGAQWGVWCQHSHSDRSRSQPPHPISSPGNVLASSSGCVVIDWEFATYGPPAYDLGSLTASFFLAAVAASLGGLPGAEAAGGRAAQAQWLLDGAVEAWAAAVGGWWEATCTSGSDGGSSSSNRGDKTGDVSSKSSSSGGNSQHSQAQSRTEWEAAILSDALAFAGCCMCRYVVGQHAYALFAGLRAPGARLRCERAALRAGRRLLAERGQIASIGAAASILKQQIAQQQQYQ